MGTVFSLTVTDPDVPAEALDGAIGWLRWVDATFTTYDEGSFISRLGRDALTLGECPPEVAEVLALGEQVAVETDGYFSCYPAGRLDPSGLVKGWSVEVASALLRAAGSANHCINAGGDVRTAGERSPGQAWRIGVAHPVDRSALAAVITGRDLAVATSGSAERGDHVLDPHTGQPARGLASVTVIGRDLTRVDAYATAAFARGADGLAWLEGVDGVEGLSVDCDATITTTAAFPADSNFSGALNSPTGAELSTARRVS